MAMLIHGTFVDQFIIKLSVLYKGKGKDYIFINRGDYTIKLLTKMIVKFVTRKNLVLLKFIAYSLYYDQNKLI